jgi:hypothetical protein
MNDHIPDTTKMINATPRMDASAHDDGAIWETGCDIERELNAANERIKQLEESENRMLNWLTEDCPEAVKKQLSNAWMKSKEAKP